MRIRFDEQLERLNVELIKMGALCEEAISAAADALLTGDISLLPKVFETDRAIDQMEGDIEAQCMRLLLQQQPVARDLRIISSAFLMTIAEKRVSIWFILMFFAIQPPVYAISIRPPA